MAYKLLILLNVLTLFRYEFHTQTQKLEACHKQHDSYLQVAQGLTVGVPENVHA